MSHIIHRKYSLALGIIMIAVFVMMLWTALMRHWSLSSYHFDLGNMHQAVFNTADGRFLQVTDPYNFAQSNRLAYHFDPILAAFAPLYLLYPGAEILIVAQALILVLGAIPLYLLGKKVLGKEVYGFAAGSLYLLYYPMHFTSIADFHAVVLSTTFFLYMFYFAEQRKFGLSLLFMALMWSTKENTTLVTGMFGLYHLLIKKNAKFGFGVMMSSGLLALFLVKVLIPSMRVSNAHLAGGYYTTDLGVNLQRLFRLETIHYLNRLLQPFMYVPLFSPVHMLIALPEVLINVLSKNGNMRTLQYHYTALLTPVLSISYIYGVKNISNLLSGRAGARFPHMKKLAGWTTPILLEVGIVLMVVFFLIKSPLQSSRYTINPTERAEVLEWQQRLSDPQIKVAATGHLSPYFSGRQYFYNFFFDFAYKVQGYTDEEMRALASHYEQAEYVLIKKSEINPHDMVKYYYQHLLQNPAYEKISDENGIEVYRRSRNLGN